jgi:uncharacterized protein YjiS (DUF1127 family)
MTTTALQQNHYSEREMASLTVVKRIVVQIISTVKNKYECSKGRSKFVRLPNHMLNDIGLTREEAYEEVGKSNWQDNAISQERRFWQER